MKKCISSWLDVMSYIEADWVSAAADTILAFSALAVFLQFRRDRLWRRKDTMRQFSEGFRDTPGARNAVLMLESPVREVPLWDAADPKDRYKWVTWDDVEIALIPASLGDVRYEPLYSAIRDSFFDLLNRFAGLEPLAKARMITDEDIMDALRRWFYIIGERDKDKPHIRNLRLFIYEHRLETAKIVFSRFGINIDSMYDNDRKSFLSELNSLT